MSRLHDRQSIKPSRSLEGRLDVYVEHAYIQDISYLSNPNPSRSVASDDVKACEDYVDVITVRSLFRKRRKRRIPVPNWSRLTICRFVLVVSPPASPIKGHTR
jgi:hypothetical protein